MASPQQTVPPPHRVKNNARKFWYRVSEGLAVNQLWSQFEKDARSSYRLYSAGLDKLQEEPSRLKRVWQMAKALFWAILEKLTPARRVLLLLALRQGQSDAAVAQLEHAVKVDPNDVNVLLFAQALRRAGRAAEADSAWAQVQRISSDPGQAQIAAGQFLSFAGLKPL